MVDLIASRAGNVLHPKTVLISNIKTLADHLNGRVLHEKYAIEGLSVKQIAQEIGVCKTAILEALKREGIPTRAAHKHHGRYSNPPYGVKIFKGHLVKCAEEQKVIKLVLQLTQQEGLSRTATARRLKEMGLKTRSGHTNWHHETIHLILKRNKRKPKSEEKNGKIN